MLKYVYGKKVDGGIMEKDMLRHLYIHETITI